MREGTDPAELRDPRLEPPVVAGRCEKLLRIIAEQRAGVRSHVLDAVVAKPAPIIPPGLTSGAIRANDRRGSGVWCKTPDE
jgi:hypothetical protein